MLSSAGRHEDGGEGPGLLLLPGPPGFRGLMNAAAAITSVTPAVRREPIRPLAEQARLRDRMALRTRTPARPV